MYESILWINNKDLEELFQDTANQLNKQGHTVLSTWEITGTIYDMSLKVTYIKKNSEDFSYIYIPLSEFIKII